MTPTDPTINDPGSGRGQTPNSAGARSRSVSGNLRRCDRETRRASVLADEHIDRVLCHIERTSNSPHSDRLKFLLSVYAGLRVAEIAGLSVKSMLDADGKAGRTILVSRSIAKRGRERTIPMHPMIRDALVRMLAAHPNAEFVAFSKRRAVRRQSVGAVKAWFVLMYRQAGLVGCSSHSGRRTFLTQLARSANTYNQSLRDVQMLAGHSRLSSTEAYIEPSGNTYALVASLGSDLSRRAA